MSTVPCLAHEWRCLRVASLISYINFPFKFSGPTSCSIRFLRYLWSIPWYESRLCCPKISLKLSVYDIRKDVPSCWKMKWLISGSVDTTTFRPTKLVRNNDPYLGNEKKKKKDTFPDLFKTKKKFKKVWQTHIRQNHIINIISYAYA